jgi:hypothetical protein
MHSGCWNVMNHIASRGTIFGRSFVGFRGFFFYHESYCDESVMTIYGFLNIHQILCDVSSGVGLYPYMGNVCLWPYMGTLQRRRFLGCIKLITLYYW